MKISSILIFITFLVGATSTLIVSNVYSQMCNHLTKNSLIKQITLKYNNFCKLGVCISNVDAFVEKAVCNYKYGGLKLNTWNNISGDMAYICIAIGIINCLIFKNDTSAIYYNLGISLLSTIVIKLIQQIADLNNKLHIVIVTMVDYLENNNEHQENTIPQVVKKFSKTAEIEFNKLNKSFEKIQSSCVKAQPDLHIIDDVLNEYLT